MAGMSWPLLRSLSALRSFHWAYGGEVTAGKIVHFLILNPQFPRSLLTAVSAATSCLDRLARSHGASTPAQDGARALMGELAEKHVEDVFEEGLHEFLERFIREISDLSGRVNDQYLSGLAR